MLLQKQGVSPVFGLKNVFIGAFLKIACGLFCFYNNFCSFYFS